MKLVSPKIKYLEEGSLDNLESDNYNFKFNNEEILLEDRKEFNECTFTKCSLNNSKLSKSVFIESYWW